MKFVSSSIATQIVLLFAASFLLAGNVEEYKVTGTLLDNDEAPVADRQVLLYNAYKELITSDQTDENGRFTLAYQIEPVSADPDTDPENPASFILGPSYPNPFNPHTTFPFHAAENTNAAIAVYNILGQNVMQTRKEISRGSHEIVVNLGSNLSQGLYLLRVMGDGFSLTQTMTFVSAGISSGNPGITLRSGGNLRSSTLSAMQLMDSEMYRLVVEESEAYLKKELQVPALQDFDAGIIELAKREYPIEITVVGEGTVEKEILTAKSYEHGTTLLLNALPDEGWQFVEWGGDLEGEENPQILLIDDPKTVSALFEALPPDVITLEVNDITSNSAAISGQVVGEGGGTVTERGVCYSTTENPDLDDTCIAHHEGGSGVFMVALSDLEPGTLYFARAYAINNVGTAYGGQLSFQTLSPSLSPFAAYLSNVYPGFRYEHVETITGTGYEAYVLRMYSQQWLSETFVDAPEWWHWITIVVPDQLQHSTGMLFITSGNRRSDQPESVSSNLSMFAVESQSVVVELHNVPFQPLTFNTGEGSRQLSEDALIAYGWRIFLEGGAKDEDVEWLAQIPMTVAAMRAMDATTEFLEQEENKTVDTFVLTGASKRGWTAWLTAAFDERVVAVAPLVIDMLNFEQSLDHHWQAYGEWSSALSDYVNEGVMDWKGSAELEQLSHLVDPFTYLDRLSMPKYIVNASGDEFFLPDSWQFYWDDLVGDKRLRYIPNSGHGVLNFNTYSSLLSFYDRVLNDIPVPVIDWEVVDDGFRIRFDQDQMPDVIKLWRADNPDARDFRLPVIGAAWTSIDFEIADEESLFVPIVAPEIGFSAWFVEATFGADQPFPFITTTGVVVRPDIYPFSTFVPNRP